MKPVTLYKKDCEPYVVTSQEALNFHINQGWVEDPDDVEKVVEVVQPVKPFIVGDVTDTPVVDDAKIKELNDIIAAKDSQIAEMQTDFEDTFTGMNSVITKLKQQLTEAGLTPVTNVPTAPVQRRNRR